MYCVLLIGIILPLLVSVYYRAYYVGVLASLHYTLICLNSVAVVPTIIDELGSASLMIQKWRILAVERRLRQFDFI